MEYEVNDKIARLQRIKLMIVLFAVCGVLVGIGFILSMSLNHKYSDIFFFSFLSMAGTVFFVFCGNAFLLIPKKLICLKNNLYLKISLYLMPLVAIGTSIMLIFGDLYQSVSLELLSLFPAIIFFIALIFYVFCFLPKKE